MTVARILAEKGRDVFTTQPHRTLKEVIDLLAARGVGAVVVADASMNVLGILSERDVVRAFAKDGARLAERRVRDLMTRDVVTCGIDATMLDAERLMNKHKIRHMPVVDGGKLVGMLSIRDIMVWRQQEAREEVNVLRDAMIAVRNR